VVSPSNHERLFLAIIPTPHYRTPKATNSSERSSNIGAAIRPTIENQC